MDQDLWNNILERQLASKKQKRKYSDLIKSLEFSDFQNTLDTLRRQYNSPRVSSCLDRISSVLSYIQSFQQAISSIVQVNDIAGVIWGTLSAICVCAAKYLSLLEKSTTMVRNLILTLARFDRYLKLFPTNPQLHRALSLLYEGYIGFCIRLAVFLKRSPFLNIFLVSFSTINEDFETTKANIEAHIHAFEVESQVSVDEVTVKGARAVQDALPNIHISLKIGLPFVDLLYPRNHRFVGRDKELMAIDSCLGSAIQDLSSCTIHGIAGVGKTQVAVEYTHRFASKFDYVMWLPAENPTILASSFSSLHGKLNLDESVVDQKSMVQSVRSWLRQNKNWLLVFDNVENWKSIAPYWPPTAQGSILVTTQNPELTQITKNHQKLQSLSADDGANLLLNHLHQTSSKKDRKIASSISEELGGLPMAIAHLAGYIDKSQTSLSSFQTQFRQRLEGSQIWNADAMVTTAHHPQKLGALWDIAFANLDDGSHEMMNTLSFLNPDSIPEELLTGRLKDGSSIADFNREVANLRERNLIERYPQGKSPYISIHRALQRNVIYRLLQEPGKYSTVLNRVIQLVRDAFPHRATLEVPDHHNWEIYERYINQLTRLKDVVKSYSTIATCPLTFADLLSDAGHYLWHRGDLQGALDILETAETICRQFPEAEAAFVYASVLVGLQAVESALGYSKRAQCLSHIKEVVRLRSKYPGPDPIQSNLLLANAHHDLGCAYLDAGEYELAGESLSQSLSIKREYGTEESMPGEFALEFEDLSYVRLGQGRTAEALELIEESVRIARIDEAANRSTILQFIFDWSVILLNSGQFDAALDKAREAFEGRKAILGDYAVHTLNAEYWIANVLYHMQKFTKAKTTLETLLIKAKKSQWSEENVARAQYRLAQVLRELGNEEGAMLHESDAMDVCRKLGLCELNQPGKSDLMETFDSMVSIYFGRSSGKLWVGCVQ